MLAPLPKSAWTPATAAHLLNRAGFGGTPDEIEQLAKLPMREAVDRLVRYEHIEESFDTPSWLGEGFDLQPNRRQMRLLPEKERRMKQQERRRAERQNLLELRAWWIYRMRYTKRPLQEKMTLFWHGHFATSFEKVQSIYAMYIQNETFRKLATANFRDLVTAVAKDPAMLIYLDNARSKPDAPNENFARELMELFTLGEGNYSEADIKEAARAFAGWSLKRQKIEFLDRPSWHDRGNKTFMGRRGRFTGDDVIEIILRQPAAAEFIAGKIWSFFAYEQPDPALVSAAANYFRQRNYDLADLLTMIFSSRAFYAEQALRTQIKSPVQWYVGMLRALDAPVPRAEATSFMLRQLGQDLFMPPNVKGWNGGATWITPATLLHRYNYAGVIVRGSKGMQNNVRGHALRRPPLPSVVDADKTLPAASRTSHDSVRRYLAWRLFQGDIREKDEMALKAYLKELPPPSSWSSSDIKRVLHTMMSTPQFQLT